MKNLYVLKQKSLFKYNFSQHQSLLVYYCSHRRRTELDDKAKVVASDWGAELVQFLAELAVLLSILGKIG